MSVAFRVIWQPRNKRSEVHLDRCLPLFVCLAELIEHTRCIHCDWIKRFIHSNLVTPGRACRFYNGLRQQAAPTPTPRRRQPTTFSQTESECTGESDFRDHARALWPTQRVGILGGKEEFYELVNS